MPAPKGHKPYAGCEKGGLFAYLGRAEDAFTEQEATEIGKELVEYMKRPEAIWFKTYLAWQGIPQTTFYILVEKFPELKKYHQQAKSIQESKLVHHSFWKEADSNFAHIVLQKHHEGWEKQENLPPNTNEIKNFISDLKSNAIKPETNTELSASDKAI